MFFAAIILVSLLGYAYIGRRLSKRPWHWGILSIPFAFLISFPVFRESEIMANFTFVAMGFLTYLFVLTLLRDLAVKLKFKPPGAVPLVFVACLAVLAGTLKAIYGIETVRVKVPVKNLPQELVGLRIVHISDLHIGPTIGKSFVEKIVNRVNAEKPDLVAFTGDIGDARVEDHHEDSAPLSLLKSTYGSFYVPGNHEVYWNQNAWVEKFTSLGMHALVNRGVSVLHKGKSVLIAGIPDPRSGIFWETVKPIRENPDSVFRILLSHRPDVAEGIAGDDYDLILAGHTHGGQFFPWTLIAMLDHRYYVGLYKLKRGHIYVNPGTGSWGPLLRLGTTPEITVLELSRAP